MMEFLLQRFGGGGETQTTSREIPAQSANEAELEDALLQYARTSMGGAYGALGNAMRLSGQLYNPNWNDIADTYTNMYKGKLDDFDSAAGALLDDYQNKMNGYLSDYEGNVNTYNNDMRNYLNEYRGSMAKNAGKWDDLVNGVLPSAYAEARQNALNADLRGTVGNAVNSLGNRGIMNSSVTNKALGDISQNASDTLYKNYLNDLQMESNLLGQQDNRFKTIYDTSAGNAGSILGANTNLYDRQVANAQAQFDTGFGGWKDRTNLWTNGLNDWSNQQATAQAASYQPVTQMLDYSNQMMAPAQNMYNQMYSGRMGTGSTTTTKSDGGGSIFPVIGSLGAAAITACFTGNTLVTTPTGYKYIKDIQAGDEVLSVSNGKIVPKKVEHVNEPVEADTIDVYFDNGTVWHTTETQRTFDGKHFAYCHVGASAVVHGGGYTGVRRVIPAGKELVYDFTVEGFAGENVFFANDVAAEGMGD